MSLETVETAIQQCLTWLRTLLAVKVSKFVTKINEILRMLFLNKKNKRITKSGVCGDTIEPILPNIEQVPIKECRRGVGKISLVMMYTIVKAAVAPNFPAKYTANCPHSESA